MELKIGLWLDNRRAVVVSISGKEEKLESIDSNVEKYFRHSGGGNPDHNYGRKDKTAYDIVDKDMEEHLKKYYKKIISQIKNADSVLIIGPGKAKQELKKYIDKNGSLSCNIEVVTSDKMSDNKILSMIRQYYQTEGAKGKRYGTKAAVSNIAEVTV